MEHQALDTLVVVHVAVVAPKNMIKSSKQQILAMEVKFF
jgi:hypothetical protein